MAGCQERRQAARRAFSMIRASYFSLICQIDGG
jgi:hypothetical protein